jgi:hypothetical protein
MPSCMNAKSEAAQPLMYNAVMEMIEAHGGGHTLEKSWRRLVYGGK